MDYVRDMSSPKHVLLRVKASYIATLENTVRAESFIILLLCMRN